MAGERFEYQKTPDELHEALQRQIGHLRRSNDIYDEGRLEEAERIAGALYVLFADYSSNHALTRLTRIRKSLTFPDSRINAMINKPKEVFIGPLLCVIGVEGEYLAPLSGSGENWPAVPFTKWWSETVYETESGLQLARKNLVFALGNQDGGRHVDRTLRDEAYHWLKAKGDFHVRARPEGGFTVYTNPKWIKSGDWVNFRGLGDGKNRLHLSTQWPPPQDAAPLKNAHWATMRQMGYEADAAFCRFGL